MCMCLYVKKEIKRRFFIGGGEGGAGKFGLELDF